MTIHGVFDYILALEADLTKPLYAFELIAVVGASGAGKTAIAEYVRKELGVSRIPSCTSRAPRAGDTEGYYKHLSPEEFLRRRERGEFFECASYGSNWYGRLRKDMDALRLEPCIGDATEEGIVTFRQAGVSVYAVQIVPRRNEAGMTEYMRSRAQEDARRTIDGLYQEVIENDHTIASGLATARARFAEIVRARLALAYTP